MKALRRFLATLLLALLLLPLALSSLALGQDAEAGLPACCRRTGKHHCAMSMAARVEMTSLVDEDRWNTPAERCPYCPGSVTTPHLDPFAIPASADLLKDAQGPSEQLRQAECRRRIARDGARQKRGPPAILLL